MMMGVYALKDSKTGFLDPTTAVNNTIAIRTISSAIASLKGTASELWNFSDDFELWKLGDYDKENGFISGKPEFLMRISDIKEMIENGVQKSV